MKSLKYIYVGIAAILFAAVGCEDNQMANPVPSTGSSSLTANFLLINASPDAPSLDFYVDNVMLGASVPNSTGQNKYASAPVTINNTSVANTNIRVKGTGGSIGGVLKTNDLIFRAGNNNSNNLSAAAGASYTVIVLDTINRPIPVRTLNEKSFGDITYYSSVNKFVSDTTINLTIGSNNSTAIANLIKKHNSNQLPSTFIPIGIVPLGSTDVGGIRFLLLTDELPLPSTTRLPVPTTGKFAARFINASPDAGSASCKINGVTVGGSTTYPLLSSNFNPTVGSRSATVSFTNNVTNSATPYDIVVTVGVNTYTLAQQTFADSGVYTILLTGSSVKGTLQVVLVQNK